MRYTLIVLASLAGLAMTGAPALAKGDCASMRAALKTAVDDVLTQASAHPIVLADLTAKVDAADAALKALNDACGAHAVTAAMPPGTAATGPAGSGNDRGETPRPSPAEMMQRTSRTHVTIAQTRMPQAASAAVFTQQTAALVSNLHAAIAANDLAGIHKIAGGPGK